VTSGVTARPSTDPSTMNASIILGECSPERNTHLPVSGSRSLFPRSASRAVTGQDRLAHHYSNRACVRLRHQPCLSSDADAICAAGFSRIRARSTARCRHSGGCALGIRTPSETGSRPPQTRRASSGVNSRRQSAMFWGKLRPSIRTYAGLSLWNRRSHPKTSSNS
jgi:hypothetical protein